VVKGEGRPIGVAADATTLFWTTSGGAVRAQALDGSGPKRDVVSFPSAGHLEAHDGFLYLTTYTDKRVVRVAKVDGAFSVLATCASECLGICTAPAPSSVYYTDRGPQALLQATNGGAGTSVTAGLTNVEDCFVAGTDVYLANENKNEVIRVPLGNPSARVTKLSVADPVAVSVDAKEIWVVSQSPGIIYKRALAGGALESVATGQAFPTGLHLTPTAAYWANSDDGTIMRLAR
jgi:sugar lactone lactonase YvrE